MALEAKSSMMKEKTEGGEVAMMKSEIHRMTVRLQKNMYLIFLIFFVRIGQIQSAEKSPRQAHKRPAILRSSQRLDFHDF